MGRPRLGPLSLPIRAEIAAELKIHRSAFEFRRIGRSPAKANGKINYEELLAQV